MILMLRSDCFGSKAKFKVDSLTVLVDKGYHNGREITQCKKSNNITTIVAHPTPGRAKDSVTQGIFGS
jgi:hypothetical protein